MRKFFVLLLITMLLLSASSASLSHKAESAGTPAATMQATVSGAQEGIASVPTTNRVLMTYFAGWAGLSVSKIPGGKITHILYAFSDLNAKGQCAVIDENAKPNMAAFKTLKLQYPDLKVLISVGGWSNSNNFSANVKTDALRKNVVSSCIDLWIKGAGLSGPGVIDGIDIDWEYPGSEGNTKDFSPDDKANYVLLMQEFRKELDAQGQTDSKHYSLSAAIPPDPNKLSSGYDLATLGKILDYFNLMAYDFHGNWEDKGPTNFHANLYPDTAHGTDYSVVQGIKAFEDGGVPANKIVLGVPFYGAGWTGVEAKDNGLYQPATGTIDPDTLTYAIIKDKYESDKSYTKYRTTAHAPWLYSASTKIFIAYDDPDALAEKAQYAVQNGLAGNMVWELSQDDSTFTLTSTLCTNLGLASASHPC